MPAAEMNVRTLIKETGINITETKVKQNENGKIVFSYYQ